MHLSNCTVLAGLISISPGALSQATEAKGLRELCSLRCAPSNRPGMFVLQDEGADLLARVEQCHSPSPTAVPPKICSISSLGTSPVHTEARISDYLPCRSPAMNRSQLNKAMHNANFSFPNGNATRRGSGVDSAVYVQRNVNRCTTKRPRIARACCIIRSRTKRRPGTTCSCDRCLWCRYLGRSFTHRAHLSDLQLSS